MNPTSLNPQSSYSSSFSPQPSTRPLAPRQSFSYPLPSSNTTADNAPLDSSFIHSYPTTSPLTPDPTSAGLTHSSFLAVPAAVVAGPSSVSVSVSVSASGFQPTKPNPGTTLIDDDNILIRGFPPLSATPPPAQNPTTSSQSLLSSKSLSPLSPAAVEGAARAVVDNSSILIRENIHDCQAPMVVLDTKLEDIKGDEKENILMQNEMDPTRSLKDEVEDLRADLGALRKCVTCVICQNLLFEPFSLQCGHIFCYMCLVEWFHHKKSCPECRAQVDRQPANAYLVRDMIETFVVRAELSSPHGTGAELRLLQKQALEAVERDKASTGKSRKGGLFQGLFTNKVGGRHRVRIGVRDMEDDVLRCPECHYEVISGICAGCEMRVRDVDDDEDEDDDLWSDVDDLDEDLDDEDDTDEDSDESSEEEDDDDSVQTRGEGFVTFPSWEDDYGRRIVGGASDPITIDDDNDHGRTQHGEDEDDDESVRGPSRRAQGNNASESRGTNGQTSRNGTRAQNPSGGPRGVTTVDLTNERALDQARARNHRRRYGTASVDDNSDEDEEEEDEEVGSLEGFIVDDNEDPHHGNRRRRRARSTSTVATNTTTVSASTAPPSTPGNTATIPRQRSRRVVLDDDDELEDDMDDQSSVSEVGPRRRNDAFFTAGELISYPRRRGPIALSSDNDEDDEEEHDDDEDSLLGVGYTQLEHDTENEDYLDDDLEARPASFGLGPRDTPSGRVTFAVEEESEEDDEPDIDGDVHMSGGPRRGVSCESEVSNTGAGNRRRRDSTPTTSSAARRTRRSTTRSGSVEDDTDSDDSEPVSRRSRRVGGGLGRIHSGSTSSGHYFRNHHHNHSSNSSSHRRQTATNRRDIDPGISQILRRHVQQRNERQFDHLAGNFSSSPARSITPVPMSPIPTGNNNNTIRTQQDSNPSLDASSNPNSHNNQSITNLSSPISPAARGASAETGATIGSSPAANTEPASPRMSAGTRVGSSSQMSSSPPSSPFPSNSLSEIANFIGSGRGRSMPAVTPPPPRTSVPTRSSSNNATISISDNHLSSPPTSTTTESSQPAPPTRPQILHHHRDHNRPPTTSPQSPPPSIHTRPQRIGHRNSRSGLREAGSRQNLRSSASRNGLRNNSATTSTSPLSPGGSSSVAGTQGRGTIANSNISYVGTVGASLVDVINVSANARTVGGDSRSRRYTPEEIRNMGQAVMARRMEELQRQRGANRSNGTAVTASSSSNPSLGNTASSSEPRPPPAPAGLATSHWRLAPNGGAVDPTAANPTTSRLTRRSASQQPSSSPTSSMSIFSANSNSNNTSNNSSLSTISSGIPPPLPANNATIPLSPPQPNSGPSRLGAGRRLGVGIGSGTNSGGPIFVFGTDGADGRGGMA